MKYKIINGWTKEKMKEAILKNNNNTRSLYGVSCAYFGKNNNRCAVGCFLPDTDDECIKREVNNCGTLTSLIRHIHRIKVGELTPIKEELKEYYISVEKNLPLNTDGLTFFQRLHDSEGIEDSIPMSEFIEHGFTVEDLQNLTIRGRLFKFIDNNTYEEK